MNVYINAYIHICVNTYIYAHITIQGVSKHNRHNFTGDSTSEKGTHSLMQWLVTREVVQTQRITQHENNWHKTLK